MNNVFITTDNENNSKIEFYGLYKTLENLNDRLLNATDTYEFEVLVESIIKIDEQIHKYEKENKTIFKKEDEKND